MTDWFKVWKEAEAKKSTWEKLRDWLYLKRHGVTRNYAIWKKQEEKIRAGSRD